MDRLVLESILADVSEVFLAKENNNDALTSSILLGFKATNADQIISAFSHLKEIADTNGIALTICNTLVTGMYDLELVTEGLDEPIRICNKVIDAKFIKEIEELANSDSEVTLGSNVSEEENWFRLDSVAVKDCNADLK